MTDARQRLRDEIATIETLVDSHGLGAIHRAFIAVAELLPPAAQPALSAAPSPVLIAWRARALAAEAEVERREVQHHCDISVRGEEHASELSELERDLAGWREQCRAKDDEIKRLKREHAAYRGAVGKLIGLLNDDRIQSPPIMRALEKLEALP
jgi:hypothetical protein